MRRPTPRLKQVVARAILRATAWNLDVRLPSTPKYVLIGAPHTSNWDLWHTLLMIHAVGLPVHWVGKSTLFRPPLGWLMRMLGGIPVNRHTRTNFVQQVVETLNQQEAFVLAIAPEGTRSKADVWKTGFYHIALGAGVPIALGFIDYRARVLGIGPSLTPSGDLRADFAYIQAFYTGKQGRRPALQGSIRLADE